MPHPERYTHHVFVGCFISFLVSFGVSRGIYSLKNVSEENAFNRAQQASYEKAEENRQLTKILKALADKDAKWPAIQTIKAVLATPDGARQGIDKIISFAEVVSRTSKEDRATFVSMAEWEGIQKLADGGELPLLVKLRDAKRLAPALKGEIMAFSPPPSAKKPVIVPYFHKDNRNWLSLTWFVASIASFLVWFIYQGRETRWTSMWVIVSVVMTAPISFPVIFFFAVIQLLKDWRRFFGAVKSAALPWFARFKVALYRLRLLRRLPAPTMAPIPNETAPSRTETVVEENVNGIMWYVISQNILLGRRHLLVKNGLDVYPISINAPRKLRGIGVRAADIALFEQALGINTDGAEDSETDIERTLYRSYVRQKNKFSVIGFGSRTIQFAQRVLKAVCVQENLGSVAFAYETVLRDAADFDVTIRCLDGMDRYSRLASFGSVFGYRSTRGRIEGATISLEMPRREVRDQDGNVLAVVKDRTIFLLWKFWEYLEERWATEALARLLHESIALLGDVPAHEIDNRDSLAWRESLAANRDRYVGLCIGRIESEMKQLLKKREQCEKEIRDAGQIITDQIRVRHGINARLENFQSGRMEREKEQLAKEFDQLAASKCVVAVRAYDDSVQVDTRTVFIKHDGETYRIGRFVMILKNDGSVSFMNRDGTVEGTFHPHIRGNGEPCLGNITEAVSKMMADRQYAAVVSLLFRYLESYNPGSPYTRIEKWKRVNKEQS